MRTKLTISRRELYDRVWSKPVTHLASEYNLSDVGLAKLCRRHNIPLPPIGYWTKLAHGHDVKKSLLPELGVSDVDSIELITRGAAFSSDSDQTDGAEDLVLQELGRNFIALGDFKKGFHPLLTETQRELREQLKQIKNLPDGERVHVHNLSVTKSSCERALTLMNMLFQVLEANGLSMMRTLGYDGATSVHICGVEAQFEIKEKTKRTEKPDREPYGRFYSYQPTGILYFETSNLYVDGVRNKWVDTRKTRLEESINDVAAGIMIAAVRWKRQKNDYEERSKKDEAQRERQKQVEAERQLEQARVQELFSDAQKWAACGMVRDYVRAVEENHRSLPLTSDERIEIDRWTTWARENADVADPALQKLRRK